MTDNTSLGNESPEDSDVIKGLREQLKTANKAVKTAGDDAVAKVKRAATASTLMPEGYEGLSDIFETEVDGELTKESAAEWLAGRGFSAPSNEIDEQAAEQAAALEAVTNLGGAVQAAGSLTPADAVEQRLAAIDTTDMTQSLPELTAKIVKAIHG